MENKKIKIKENIKIRKKNRIIKSIIFSSDITTMLDFREALITWECNIKTKLLKI